MKKLMVLLLVLIVVSAGCISGNTSQPQTSESNKESTSTGSTTPTETTPQKEGTVINPFKAIDRIKQYTYSENSSVEMLIETETGNITEQINVSLLILENGYVDLEDKKAKIQTKTTTLPDNMTVNTTWIIIGDNVYYADDLLGIVNVKNDTLFWRINPVSLAKKLLELDPVGNYTENGTLVLVYSVPEEIILPLAEFYLSVPDTNTTVTDATAELYFTEDGFTGMKLIYGILVTTTVEDIGGEMEVTERGHWKGTIKITSINKKEEVEVPST